MSGTISNPWALEEFWDGASMDEDPRLVKHPLRDKSYRAFCLPIGIHADGVPVKKADPGASLKVGVDYLCVRLPGIGACALHVACLVQALWLAVQ